MKYVSDQVADLVRAGGRAGVGSHGQFQGLAFHWELWSLQQGKLTDRGSAAHRDDQRRG
jgi:hypothetical protein